MNRGGVVLALIAAACSSSGGSASSSPSSDAIDPATDAAAPEPTSAPTSPAAPTTSVDAAAPPSPPDAGATPAGCAPTATAGHQEIDCAEGVHMDVEVSAQCATGGCGIIFDVHGFTMTADELDTHTRMRLLAPPLGYVVVQPTAAGLWGNGDHDDVVWAFAEATASVLKTDPDRLHFMGFSQGATLTFHMLCDHSDAIASIAPDSGAGCFTDNKTPAVERPILYVQGTTDNIQPWSLFGPPVRDGILGAWPFGPSTPIRSGTKYSANRWSTTTGTDFEFWQHDYKASVFLGGHCLAVPDGTGQYRCNAAEFDYSAEVLRFFGAHRRTP